MATADIGGDGTTTVRKLEGFGVLVISTAIAGRLRRAYDRARRTFFCDGPGQHCVCQIYTED